MERGQLKKKQISSFIIISNIIISFFSYYYKSIVDTNKIILVGLNIFPYMATILLNFINELIAL